MKNLFLSVFFAFAVSVMGYAQAVLPTSWNFDDATPTGWTESLGGSNTRYTNGMVGQACRLDQTNDYVQIYFAEEAGALSYNIKGQNQGGAWEGTFTIEESVDGSAFTPLFTFSGAALPTAAFTAFNHTPNAASRYLRFYFTTKVSGHNVALDEVSLGLPTASSAQEINITDGTNSIPNNFTYVMGNNAQQNFIIENLGLANDLNVTAITLGGVNASEFTLLGSPVVIAAGGSNAITLDFNPIGSGSRFCTITVESDDTSEGTYSFDVYAIAGDYATEPTAAAQTIAFSNVSSWDYNVTVNAAGNDAEKFIVLRKQGSAVTEAPMDGYTYVVGEMIGDAQVVYVGEQGTAHNARYIGASTTYHYAAFAFNGPPAFENYLTSSPTVNSVTTNAPDFAGYYAGVDVNSAAFVGQLTAALNPANFFQIFYSNYTSTLINNFYVQDAAIEGESLNMVECQYSMDPQYYPGGFQWWNGQTTAELSREHSYPQSWMPTYFDAGFDDSDEVSDLHNLFPVNQEECNAVRSNYPYGEVVNPTSTYLETALGTNALNQTVYEPREEFKGNAARGIMYQAAKHHTSSSDFSLPEQISIIIPYGQNEYLLKQWHFNDAPDNLEIARNEYIETEQHNRNPFIDDPTYACYVRFQNMTKWAPLWSTNANVLTCTDQGLSYQWYMNGVAIEGATTSTYEITQTADYSVEVQQFEQCPVISSPQVTVNYVAVEELPYTVSGVSIYPNPSAGDYILEAYAQTSQQAILRTVDATGRVVTEQTINLNAGQNRLAIQNNLSAGYYQVQLIAGAAITRQGLIIK